MRYYTFSLREENIYYHKCHINIALFFSTRGVFSFITSLWLVGLRQISVLSVFRKMWCNSWCNTIFQKVFNAKYYTFAGLSTLNDCISISLLWCNTPRKYYTSITPNSPKWCNTFKGITPHLTY